MSSLFTAQLDFAVHQLEKSILCNVADAKLALGLDAIDAIRDHRLHIYTGPTYIASCRINGWQEMDMYDDRPGFAYFTSDCSMSVELPPSTLEQACSFLTSKFIGSHWYSNFPGDPDKGESELEADSPSSGFRTIDLLDNLGNEVARATLDHGRLLWTSQLHGIDIDANLKEASRLDAEASYERGMADNFETARQLNARATALRKEASIATNQSRLVA